MTVYSIYHNPPEGFTGFEPMPIGLDRNFLCADMNIGNNISKSPFEVMRGHYFVWKNCAPTSFVGFQHYRRSLTLPDSWDFDFAAPQWKLEKTVREQYGECHDYSAMEALLTEVPEFNKWADQDLMYVCCMFVAPWSEFCRYMEFWWPLVQKLAEKVEVPADSPYRKRMFGFLSERILSFWLMREQECEPGYKVQILDMTQDLSWKLADQ